MCCRDAWRVNTPSTGRQPVVPLPPAVIEAPSAGPNGGSSLHALDRRKSTTTAALLVLTSCVSLQFGAALAYQLFPHVGAWGMNSLRLGIAAIILALAVRPKVWRWSGRQWLGVILFGITLALMNGFFYAGIERIPLGTAVAIEFMGPLILTALLSRRWREGLWIALALCGMGLFFVDSLTGTPLDPAGVGFILIAATAWAAYILVGQRVGQSVPGAEGLAGALVVAALVVAPVGLPTALPALAADPSMWLIAIPASLLASLIPYSLEFAAMKRLPKPVFGILLSLEPAVATLFGFLLLAQAPSALGLVAVALVVSASVGSTLSARG